MTFIEADRCLPGHALRVSKQSKIDTLIRVDLDNDGSHGLTKFGIVEVLWTVRGRWVVVNDSSD